MDSIEDINTDLIILKTENFLPWLELQFSKKYKVSLEDLQERFLSIYNLFKLILQQVTEIEHILKEESDLHAKQYTQFQNKTTSQPQSPLPQNYQQYAPINSNYSNHKPLLDNMILLLTMIIGEFTECLDLEFVEHFFLSVEERSKLLIAHIHQLLHMPHNDPHIISKINTCTKTIDNYIKLIPTYVKNLQKRAELSVPLLKHIKEAKLMFRIPLKKLREKINELAEDNSYKDYQKIIDEITHTWKGSMKFKYDYVMKMIDLVKENSQYQFELKKMLKPYHSMATLIHTKGKKLLNENIGSMHEVKLQKYVKLLLKQDFCNNWLPNNIDVNELIFVIQLFESQTKLVNEYKKTLMKGIEEYQVMKQVEFKVILEKFKLVIAEGNEFQTFAQKNIENKNMSKESVNQIFKDIKKVVDKYKEFQNRVYCYQGILELFQKIRNLALKFCYEEFGVKVELICEYNL